MNRKSIRDILFFFLCTIFILGIIFIPNFKKNYKSNKYIGYSTTLVEGFEKRLFGATGWAAIDLPLKESANNNSTTIFTVGTGQVFTILGESGDYWEIVYTDSQNVLRHGYIQHDYCMINLPDVVPSIKYNITNASASIYKSSGYDITSMSIVGDESHPEYNITGSKLYFAGKVQNDRIGRNEYIVPSLYSTSKKIAKAQGLIKQQNKSLMIYDSYRPVSVSQKVSVAFGALADSNSTVATGISGWDRTWFIATITPGVNMSAHNVAAAIDVSIWDDQTNQEVNDMPTAMHELSTSATRCTNSSCSQLSSGMSNSASAMLLSNVMTNSNVGMGTLASEWWHYQDNDGLNRMKNATNITGRDFQVTNIVSTYGFSSSLATVGDVNADGYINASDAELTYNTYELLNLCETCSDLKSQVDINSDNSIDFNDIYAMLNSDNDLLTSSVYTIADNYIFVGNDTFSNSNVTLKNVSNVSSEVSNNKYLIKYHDNVIKEYDIVSYSYTGHDLSKSYIFLEQGLTQISTDISSGDFNCINCVVSVDSNKVNIKKNSMDEQALASYDLVYYTSDYSLNGNSLDIYDTTVTELLAKFQCTNCVVGIYNNSTLVSSGNVPDNSQLLIKENVSGNSDTLKSVSINILVSVSGVQISSSSLNLGVNETNQLSAIVSPSTAYNKNVTWDSSDTSVATVDNDGNVTAIGVGSATITVTTVDGNYTDTCLVNVVQKYAATYRWGNGEHDSMTNYYLSGVDVISNINEPSLLYMQGKKLIGWNYNNHVYGLNDTLLMPSNDIELVAEWENISDGINNNYQVETISTMNKVLKGISLNTDVSDLNLGLSNEYIITLFESDNATVKTSGKLGTGDIIKVYVGDELVDKYVISIKGDVNGDGEISISDVSMIYKKIKRKIEFSYAQSIASNVNDDEGISVSDVSIIYKHIKNKIDIFAN